MSDLLHISPVIPVVNIAELEDAVPLAQALLEGGIGIIEVTLRTPAGLSAIAAIAEHTDLLVGAGTIRCAQDARDAVSAGAGFLVSPGTTREIHRAFAELDVPALPGCATVSEVLTARDHGHRTVKWFPAQAAGGVPALRALASVLPDMLVCPTGGITPATATDYLSVPTVPCVGGSWLTPQQYVQDRDWAAITGLAQEAVRLTSNG